MRVSVWQFVFVAAAVLFSTPASADDLAEWVKLLDDSDANKRGSAAVNIGSMASELGPKIQPAVPELIRHLKDKDPEVRSQCAWALGVIGVHAKSSLPALNAALKDSDDRVRKAAQNAIDAIRNDENPKPKKAEPNALYQGKPLVFWLGRLPRYASRADASLGSGTVFLEGRAEAIEAVASFGAIAVPSVLKLFSDKDPEVHELARWVLKRMSAEAVPLLLEAANEKSEVGKAARETLAEMKREDAKVRRAIEAQAKPARPKPSPTDTVSVDELLTQLSNMEPDVRRRAAISLGRLGGQAKEAIPALEKTSNDDNQFVAKAAREALDKIRSEPTPKAKSD
jgi:HEAT repeat protein